VPFFGLKVLAFRRATYSDNYICAIALNTFLGKQKLVAWEY